MFSEVVVALPPLIARESAAIGDATRSRIEDATREISVLDESHAVDLAALGQLLVRTESVASSKIEHIDASTRDFARALHGIKSNAAAVSMVAATQALTTMVDEVGQSKSITLDTIKRSHRALMIEDPFESAYAGRVRDLQNWIGGSDHSPRDAIYIPPPPETVADYLEDLIDFVNREDLPALVQAAIAHAQFESIHPFTDGNGRIGRALVNSVLRRRGVTRNVVVPIASAIVARREEYFGLLDSYRAGRVSPIIDAFARAAEVAARESRASAVRLGELRGEWRAALGRVRAGDATDAILSGLSLRPILTVDDAISLAGTSRVSVHAAIRRLVEHEILIPLTDRQRGQAWGAADVLNELDDLGRRIGHASARL